MRANLKAKENTVVCIMGLLMIYFGISVINTYKDSELVELTVVVESFKCNKAGESHKSTFAVLRAKNSDTSYYIYSSSCLKSKKVFEAGRQLNLIVHKTKIMGVIFKGEEIYNAEQSMRAARRNGYLLSFFGTVFLCVTAFKFWTKKQKDVVF